MNLPQSSSLLNHRLQRVVGGRLVGRRMTHRHRCHLRLLAEVSMPDKHTRQRSGKTKNEKRVPIKKGPIEVDVDVGWDALLVLLAELLQTSPDNLVHSSFEWHWLKPVSGAWLPLTDERGLSSMLKQILTKARPYIIVRMQPPKVDSTPVLVSMCVSAVNWELILFYFSLGQINLTLPLLKTSLRRIWMLDL